MYLSFALKIAFSNFSHWERSFWASVASHSHNLLSWTKHSIGVLEALKKYFVHLSSKMTFFCKKAQTHENLSPAFQKTVYFIRKKHFSCTWALLLKLHLATFSHWERSFWASVGLAFSWFAHENLSSALQKTVHFIRKKHFSCAWLLKLHLATFSHWEIVFEHLWPRILIICLVALNTELVFLEALKKWFCAFKL